MVIAAPIYADLIYRSVECSFSVGTVQATAKAEPEIACFLKRDLPPRRGARSNCSAVAIRIRGR
jgi:hypothetical protein